MPIFLIFNRLFRSVSRYRVRALAALAVSILLVGAALFSLTQGVDFGTAVYWAITTATTVGYGDVLPHDTFGRILASVVMLTTIPIVGTIFGLVAGASAVSHIRRILGMDAHLPTEPYTIVFGLHPIVPRVLEELCRSDDPAVLVAATRPPGTPKHVVFVGGDPTDEDVIARADPTRADRALIACVEDADTMVVAVALHGLAPRLKKYALTQSPRVARALRELASPTRCPARNWSATPSPRASRPRRPVISSSSWSTPTATGSASRSSTPALPPSRSATPAGSRGRSCSASRARAASSSAWATTPCWRSATV